MLSIVALLILGCTTPEPANVASIGAVEVEPATLVGWEKELAWVDREIAGVQRRLQTNPNQWMVESQLAGLYTSRARLTGNYDDYAMAERAIDRAFDIAPEGSGPFTSRASLNFTLHRLNAVEADLAAAEKRINLDNNTRAGIVLLRARVEMERGNYTAAAEGYAESLKLHETLQVHSAIAHHAWQTGDLETAERQLATSEAMYHGRSDEPRAWFHLQRAITDLEAKRYDEALAHLADADAAMPGYWLVREHIAEIKGLQGDLEGSLAIYEIVVPQTQNPELMGAMAGILTALDRADEAAVWIERADRLFAERIKRYPEAASGHALEHALEYGDVTQALGLAEANAALRPNGIALNLLAEAYLKADRLDDAQATIARAKALGWAGTPAI